MYESLDLFSLESNYTGEQKTTMQTLRRFLKENAAANIKEHYLKETFPTELIPGIASLGLLGSNLSGYGLPGADALTYGLTMRELERCDSGLRSFVSVQGALVMFPIWAFGSEEQKQSWLPQLARGEAIGCFGLTESHGGSDPAQMNTKATKQGNKWIIHGSKSWITNGNLAKISIVWARTPEGIRGFIVPLDRPGVQVQAMKGKLSLRASVTSELFFDNVEVGEDALLPGSSIGIKAPLSCLTQARFGIAWGVLGAAEACFHEVLDYCKKRTLFGGALSSKQLVQRKLALMATDITKAQLVAQRLSELKEQNKLHFSQVSLAKQNNVEMALNVARTCRDMLGANGIMVEYQTMRHMCNLETVNTYEGTSDIHLLILGSYLTGVEAF